MTAGRDRRRATRINVQIPAKLEVLRPPTLDGARDLGYEYVAIPTEMAGEHFEANIDNLSVNGAKLVAHVAPPVLSRLSVSFELPGYGAVLAVAIVMWRRTSDFVLPSKTSSKPAEVLTQSGVLFEAIDLEVRNFIALMVKRSA